METKEKIHKLFEDNPDYNEFAFEGYCSDCNKETTVIITMKEKGFEIIGGAVYEKSNGIQKIKCDTCFKENPVLKQRCEVYSRVVGYLRPTKQWNNGKQKEFKNRKMFKMEDQK